MEFRNKEPRERLWNKAAGVTNGENRGQQSALAQETPVPN
jgi:hypothetical protein